MNKFFEADVKGQNKVLPVLRNMFSGFNTKVEPHFDDYTAIDIYMSASTSSTLYKYAIECKDRDMSHDKYDSYILEDSKREKLLEAFKEGYKPIYINTFTDDYMVVWDLSKIDFNDCAELKALLPATTVEYGAKKNKKNKLLKIEDSKCIVKMK